MNNDFNLLIFSVLRLLHFEGIVLGIGSATLLDLILLRFALSRVIREEHVKIVIFSSQIVTIGLILLWVSGIGFFLHYWYFNPIKLENTKLLAKVIIVEVLTLNAFLVHYFVLPQIKMQIGQRLFDDLSWFPCFLMVFIGTVSVISWYVPLVLGVVKQFNFIPAELILSDYSILIFLVNVIVQTALIIKFYGYGK